MKLTTLIYRTGKKFLRIVPLKREIYSLIKLVYIPPVKISRELKFNASFRVKTEGITFKMMNYDYDRHTLENDVFWLGIKGWEPESAKLWIKLCKTNKVIFDIGANTGIYSLLAAAANPSSVIYGFEPVARIFKKYHLNLSLNHFNVTHEQLALSDKNGTAVLYDFSEDVPLNATLNSNWGSDTKGRVEMSITTERLDSYIERKNIQQVDLIKIDVELHEPEVLTGMGKYLKQFQPTLLIEIFNEEMWNRVTAVVGGIDYLFFFINEKGSLQKITGFDKFPGYNFLFCTPDTARRLNLI